MIYFREIGLVNTFWLADVRKALYKPICHSYVATVKLSAVGKQPIE